LKFDRYLCVALLAIPSLVGCSHREQRDNDLFSHSSGGTTSTSSGGAASVAVGGAGSTITSSAGGAVTEATGSTTTTSGAGGNTASVGSTTGGLPVGNCEITINQELSPAIQTVGIVTFSTNMASLDEANIEFGLDTTYGYIAPVDLTEPDYRTLLLGMKQDQEYNFRVGGALTKAATSGITTGITAINTAGALATALGGTATPSVGDIILTYVQATAAYDFTFACFYHGEVSP
jgi:hypothetical protein